MFGITQYVACVFHLVIKILISCLLKMISLCVGVLAFSLFDVSELTVSDINWGGGSSQTFIASNIFSVPFPFSSLLVFPLPAYEALCSCHTVFEYSVCFFFNILSFWGFFDVSSTSEMISSVMSSLLISPSKTSLIAIAMFLHLDSLLVLSLWFPSSCLPCLSFLSRSLLYPLASLA